MFYTILSETNIGGMSMNMATNPKSAASGEIAPIAPPSEGDANGLNDLLNAVHNADCVELMRSMPAESVSVALADPPFNLRNGLQQF